MRVSCRSHRPSLKFLKGILILSFDEIVRNIESYPNIASPYDEYLHLKKKPKGRYRAEEG